MLNKKEMQNWKTTMENMEINGEAIDNVLSPTFSEEIKVYMTEEVDKPY